MCKTNGHFLLHLGRALVTEQYKYIWNLRDMDELYDLKNDPYELNNLVNDESFAEILTDLKSRLENWRQKTNDTVPKRDLRKDSMNFAKGKSGQSTLIPMLDQP